MQLHGQVQAVQLVGYVRPLHKNRDNHRKSQLIERHLNKRLCVIGRNKISNGNLPFGGSVGGEELPGDVFPVRRTLKPRTGPPMVALGEGRLGVILVLLLPIEGPADIGGRGGGPLLGEANLALCGGFRVVLDRSTPANVTSSSGGPTTKIENGAEIVNYLRLTRWSSAGWHRSTARHRRAHSALCVGAIDINSRRRNSLLQSC